MNIIEAFGALSKNTGKYITCDSLNKFGYAVGLWVLEKGAFDIYMIDFEFEETQPYVPNYSDIMDGTWRLIR